MARLLGLIALTALWAVAPVTLPGFERFHLTKELLTLALAVPLLFTLRSFRPDALDAGALALLAAACLSALGAVNPMLATRGVSVLAVGVLCFCAARGLTEAERARLGTILLVGVTGVALLALAEAIGLTRGVSLPGHAPGATVGNRNNVAHLMTLATPLAIARWSTANDRRERAALAVLLSLFAAIVVVTRCRAAWLVFPIVAFAAIATLRARPRVAGPLAIGIVIGLLLPVRLEWRTPDFYRDTAARLLQIDRGSGLGRVTQATASLALVAQRPLVGVGPQHWKLHYPRVSPPGDPTFAADQPVPNGRLLLVEPLAIAIEWGLPALLLAIALAWKAANRETLALIAAAGLLGLFDAIVQLPATMVFVALAVGRGLPRAAGPPFPIAVRGLAAVAIVPAVFFLALEWEGLRRLEHGTQHTLVSAAAFAPWDYDVQATLGEAHALAGRCTEAAPHLQRAQAAAPWFPYVKGLCVSDREGTAAR